MALPDDNESTYAFTPLMVSQGSRAWAQLSDLAVDLVDKSAALRSSLPAPISRALAGLVRSMNCYYSNLIEGHNTHPVDIERACITITVLIRKNAVFNWKLTRISRCKSG